MTPAALTTALTSLGLIMREDRNHAEALLANQKLLETFLIDYAPKGKSSRNYSTDSEESQGEADEDLQEEESHPSSAQRWRKGWDSNPRKV